MRKGHRGAVSKLIKKFEEVKGDESAPGIDELSNIASALQKKLTVITELNDKILAALDEEEIEAEIPESDEYIFNLESTIQQVKRLIQTRTSRLNVHAHSFPSSQDPAASTSISTDAQSFTPQPPLVTGLVNSENESQVHAQESQRNVPHMSASVSSSIYHRLPKLDLPVFDGDVLEWQSFWDSYESAIHTNQSLSDVQRFTYLKSLLKYDALQTVSGFAITNINYGKAVALLHERYGQKHRIVQTYMQALLDLPAPMNTISSLRTFFDKTEIYIRGLESLDQMESSYGALLVPVILKKIPDEIRKNIAREHGSSNWSLSELRKCLLKELNVMEAGNSIVAHAETLPTTATFFTNTKPQTKPYHKSKPPSKSQIQPSGNDILHSKRVCAFCRGPHSSADCTTIIDYTERISIVKRDHLCFNCLGRHRVADCKSKSKCRHCSRKHHTGLCKDALQRTDAKTPAQDTSTENHNAKESSASVQLHSSLTHSQGHVLLKTAIGPVSSGQTSIDANILLDEGAQRSFITTDLARKLELVPTGKEALSISGFGDARGNMREFPTATVYLQTEAETIPLDVLIVPDIAVPLKTYPSNTKTMSHLKGLKLAHPAMNDGYFEIMMLIGADYYWAIVQDRVVRGNGPTAVESKLGYLLSGPIDACNKSPATSMMNIMTAHSVEEVDLEKFWKVESLGIEKTEPEQSQKSYLQEYQNSCISFKDGKYYAKLPWRDNHSVLPTNEEVAKRRTQQVIQRLKRDPALLQVYGDIISEQERRGFIEKIPECDQPVSKIHYIPHHPVRKESATTPIRIVYDCGCRSLLDSPSLNDCLMNTPPTLNDITSLFLRFRSHKYAVTTDIEKAFLNIGLAEEDRDATRFYWLSNPEDPDSTLQTYRFKSVLFGATCSPFILNAVILKLLNSNKCTITDMMLKDLYVDNIVSSLPSEEMLLDYFTTGRAIFKEAGFNLRSWASNSQALTDVAKQDNIQDNEPVTKVLGLRWETQTDVISFPNKDNVPSEKALMTKRTVLRQSSSTYDPLGILSPITVRSKILMQSLWQRKFEWDEPLPEDVTTVWTDISHDLSKAAKTEISRCYFKQETDSSRDKILHVFTDSSMKAYGACAYIVSGNESSLVMARNRVAPLRSMTIPKLELMAAVVGARLCDHVMSNLQCTRVYLWSDSQIVLRWLSAETTHSTFVNNRVKDIKTLTGNYQWKYCPTDANPADLLSRGLRYDKFRDNSLWMQGPVWLTDDETWPVWAATDTTSTPADEPDEPHISSATVANIAANDEKPAGNARVIDLERFNSYEKLLRVTAYVLRFTRRHEKKTGPLSTTEIDAAALEWIRSTQQTNYPDISRCLQNDTSKKPNLVRQLNLYMDERNLIRCRGRIHNAPLDVDAKFPYLLPPKDRLTTLIIEHAHVTHLHSGLESTVTFLRQTFWIPNIRQRVRSAIHRCTICRKVSGQPYRTPEPPPLPKDRLRESPPFTVTGVDFTGALYIKGKDGNQEKVYICLFTCANTRAVHLEVVSNLTEEAFLLAFRRFAARMSTPKVMISDNALTYVASARTIERLTNATSERLATHGTTWKFIPQRAPWYGGWWERLIGLTKNCLRKVLGRSFVTLVELQTIITEVECILNDRPLTYVSSDPVDEQPLSPSHLLYGRPITSFNHPDERPEEVETNVTRDTLKGRSQRVHQITQHFWTRWRNEYLTSLREFHRYKRRDGHKARVGDVVLVHKDSPRNTWPLGVVHELLPGGDGAVRAARVRIKGGITTRPITKLYPMEINCEDNVL
ncbi:MAG: DUF1759 domain-containing protein [Candidatus Thiodiazotropha sp.]